MRKNPKSEKKLQNVAETCTGLIVTAGVSAEDALAIVLNMLKYHSSLIMDQANHDSFIAGVKLVLRQAFGMQEADSRNINDHMSLKDIFEYIEPLLGDERMATQCASLTLHFAEGKHVVVRTVCNQ